MSEKTKAALLPALNEIKWDNLDSYDLAEESKGELRRFILNQNPPASWVKTHPYEGFQYLPIDKVEYLLDKFFPGWYLEIHKDSPRQLANGVSATVRLHYYDPILKKPMWQDGAGGCGLQLNKGVKGWDISQIKHTAVDKAVGKAITMAEKDAAERIGRIFGRDITRKNLIAYKAEGYENLLKEGG